MNDNEQQLEDYRRALLQGVCERARVLNIGTGIGRNALCMATTAETVHCVSDWNEHWDAFLANLTRHPLPAEAILIHRGPIPRLLPLFVPRVFDVVCIDLSGAVGEPLRYYLHHASRLADPVLGTIFVQGDFVTPEVSQVVDEFCANSAWRVRDHVGSFWMLRAWDAYD